jgi:hypothetical protein
MECHYTRLNHNSLCEKKVVIQGVIIKGFTVLARAWWTHEEHHWDRGKNTMGTWWEQQKPATQAPAPSPLPSKFPILH